MRWRVHFPAAGDRIMNRFKLDSRVAENAINRKEGEMLENNTYNLMEQITEESKSLWRIRNTYKKDAAGCGECNEFWDKMIKDKEQHIKDLEKLIHSHIRVLETVRR
jgi:hypothetical protein